MESELSTRDVQRVVFILVDGDFQDDVLGFGAVALVAVRFDDDDPEQSSDSAWLFYWKNVIQKIGSGKSKRIQLSKNGPSDPVMVMNRKHLLRDALTDVDT